MTPDDLSARIDRLCDRLAADGVLRSQAWREALHAVPRHLFIPERAWASPNAPGEGYIIDRGKDPAGWWDAVYSDTAIITQRADGTADVGDTSAVAEPSSSCSAPSTVAEFLDYLAIEDHNKVLEVGTGTGWTAALLSRRVGAGNVTSVDVDPLVSEIAGKNLADADYRPRLIVGDGAVGCPDGVPFDRVHVAVSVAQVPYTWVEQIRPGGIIVLPFMPGFGFGWLTRLHALGDGTAIGRFPGFAGYMMLRDQRPVAGDADLFIHGEFEETITRLDPRRLKADHDAHLSVAALVPGVQTRMYYGDGDAAGECTFWVLERGTREGSWASVDYVPGRGEYVVQQHGERRLWDEVEAAYWRWHGWGRPERGRFGLTVGSDGQRVWLDSPDRVLDAGG